MLSVIVPARNELYLPQTVDDLLAKATGKVEVIVVLDGYWPTEWPKEDPRLTIIHRERRGMRASINGAAAVAKGDFLLKVDAHCMFAKGYDEALAADCDGDWIVIPRRYSLNALDWTVRQDKMPVDYEYLGWPYHKRMSTGKRTGLHAWTWDARNEERVNRLVDENMIFQGSCWFMPKKHFERLDDDKYGTFIGEAVELGMKTWLRGGKVMVNKKTWYAHLYKGKAYRDQYKARFGASYGRVGNEDMKKGHAFCTSYWMNNEVEKIVERFWPVPSWPEDRSLWKVVPEWL